jgi:predicted nucleic acid-binding protein
MSFIVDASMAAAWVLPDEQSEPTDAASCASKPSTRAPSLFWHEARSLLLAAERKGRLRPGEACAFMRHLRRLPIEDTGQGSDAAIFTLAAKYGLSTYDATYLALAMADGSLLATLDQKLAAAVRGEGLPVIGPLGTVGLAGGTSDSS